MDCASVRSVTSSITHESHWTGAPTRFPYKRFNLWMTLRKKLVSHIKSIILNIFIFAFHSRIYLIWVIRLERFGVAGNTLRIVRRACFFLTTLKLMSRYTIGENCINFLLSEKSRVYVWPQTFQAFHFRVSGGPLKYLIWHVYMIPLVIVFRTRSNIWN